MPLADQVTVIAQCGPECRHASPLMRTPGEWAWCSLRGEPRLTGGDAEECGYFAPAPEFAGSARVAPVLYSARSATDRSPHEN